MALGSTQPLTEMSTRGISLGGKGDRCVRLTTLPPSCAVVTKSVKLNFLETSGPVKACDGTALPFTSYSECVFVEIGIKHAVRYCPGVDSASNRNEYQEYSLGVKAAGA